MEPKFLVCDDDPSSCDLLKTMLTAMGCEVEAYQDPTLVLEMLLKDGRSKEFDAIFLDLMMPQLSGFAVLERLRANAGTSNLPVIAITSLDGRAELVAGYSAGFDYYITKPFTKEQLVFGLDLLFADTGGDQPRAKVHQTKYDV